MEKTKIYSALLDRELEAEKRGKRYIIKHAVLEKLSNSISNLKYKLDVIASSPTHAVVVCEMRLGEQSVSTIGESTSETLWADAEKNYPVTMAWNRAFDRAIIRILDFGDLSVYSNKEINNKQTGHRQEGPSFINAIQDMPELPDFQDMPELPDLPDAMSDVFEDHYAEPGVLEDKTYTQKNTTSKKEENTDESEKKTPRKKVKPDDIILFGRFKGYRFREIKNTKEYGKFLAWVRSEDVEFADPKKKAQFEFFKEIANAAQK